MAKSLLEPDFEEPFATWKAANTPEGNHTFLKTIQPVIDDAINAHVGRSNPLLISRARKMSLDAMRTYDPSRARLRTHLFNQLQGLKRVNRQQSSVLRVPERISLDRYHLGNATQEMRDTLGRDPSDAELSDHTGFSMKRLKHVRTYNPAVAEGTLEAAHPEAQMVFGGVRGPAPKFNAWHEIVYHDLSPMDQLIFEHSTGYNGKTVLSNEVLASKLRRSGGLISQRKKFIQQLLDREEELSPFS